MRRDYESLYALGVAFTAFAAAEAVGGSGFLAAFAAGLVIAALDVELCDCFLDYGEASAEMFLLLTFVAFGASLIWTGFAVADCPTLLFAARRARRPDARCCSRCWRMPGMDPRSRRLIAWFGPRGLSSLLLVLLPVFAGMPGAERLFRSPASWCCSRCCCTAAGSRSSSGRRRGGRAPTRSAAGPAPSAAPRPRPAGAASETTVPERITIPELRRCRSRASRSSWPTCAPSGATATIPDQAQGAIRLPPDDAVRLARERGLDQHGTVVLYCA